MDGLLVPQMGFWIGEVPFISMNATLFNLGNTANFDWTGSSVDPNATDVGIQTALTLVPDGYDFDFLVLGSAFTTANGPVMGFYDNGTTASTFPTASDITAHARNNDGAAGSVSGWLHQGSTQNVDGAQPSTSWMSGVYTGVHRRTDTYKGSSNLVLAHTFTEISGHTAGGFFIGCTGGTHAWQFGDVKYRAGLPGTLPAI